MRVQAVVALAKLQGGDEGEEEEEEEDADSIDRDESEHSDGDETLTGAASSSVKTARKQLIEVLRRDPSAEARRAALFNLPMNATTLPFILERLRDTDAINRRCVYLGNLNAGLTKSGLDPLSQEQTNFVAKTGLGEREESVKKACSKLLSAWADQCQCNPLLLVERFDGLLYTETTMFALKSAFETRPALLDNLAFDDEFWTNLTPNSALLARSAVEFLKTKGRMGESRLEELLPLVMALAFRIQSVWAELIDCSASDQPHADTAEIAESQAAILNSLLHIALNSDYGDEIGRRKMFTLVREMIAHPSMPRLLIEPCIDVVLKLSAGQRDFVRIVVEIVQELADEDEEDDTAADSSEDEADEVEGLVQSEEGPRSRRSAKGPRDSQGNNADDGVASERRAATDTRRLLMVRAMLERMASNLHENTAIHGLIPQLIAPAVKSKDARVREQGLSCLGLCCLLDSRLALDTFPLFLDQIQRGEGEIKLRATQIVFDQLLVHGIPYLSSRQAQAAGGGAEAMDMAYTQIVGFLLSLLEDDEEGVQAVAAEGMAKMMLAGMVEDDEALRSLVLVYMSPETVSNQEMRQCLSYFLPVYCFSSSTNQRRLQRVMIPVLQVLTEVYNEVAGEQEMVTPAQVGSQLIDWSDPTKSVNVAQQDRCLHFDVALELVQNLVTSHDRDERRIMAQMLSKLSMPAADDLDDRRGKSLFILMAKLRAANPFDDSTTNNAFVKFEAACAKRYPTHFQAAQEADLATDDDLEQLRSFLERCNLDLAVNDDDWVNGKGASTITNSEPKSRTNRTRAGATSRGKAAPRVGKGLKNGIVEARKAPRSVSATSTATSTSRGSHDSMIQDTVDEDASESGLSTTKDPAGGGDDSESAGDMTSGEDELAL